MSAHVRSLLFVAFSLVAIVAFQARIRREMIDFVTWRQAAVRALNAEPLYRSEDGHYQFKYFPMFAVMMAPFGALDEDTGKIVWFAASVAFLVALMGWSVALLPERRLSQQVILWITIALMAKFYSHELLLGQVNLMLGALLMGALIAITANRPLVAGGLVGLAVFIKPYALIVLPWLLVTQGLPSALVAGFLLALGLVFPSVLYGWNGNVELLRGWMVTVTDSTPPNLLGSDNVSIAAMWAKWLGPGALASGFALLTIVSVMVLVVVIWLRRRSVKAPAYLEWALIMLLMPLISPQGWDYVLLLATPAVVLLVDRWRELTTPWRWVVGVALALMGFTMFDIMGRALYGQFMAMSAITVCALALAVGLVHVRSRGIA